MIVHLTLYNDTKITLFQVGTVEDHPEHNNLFFIADRSQRDICCHIDIYVNYIKLFETRDLVIEKDIIKDIHIDHTDKDPEDLPFQ